ncbi:MAG: hypothetical protein JWP23_1469, partial [Phenylobacterium sp.]|nr:hypothetical protein [Phenylobacterium sp.]
ALANFGIDEDTSKYMFLVCFLDLKFAQRLARECGELQIQHTSQPAAIILHL